MGHEEQALMPDPNDIPRRRRVLVLDVTQAAAEVSRLTREAYDLSLPVEPGVRKELWSKAVDEPWHESAAYLPP
jgi:hypothetical protein